MASSFFSGTERLEIFKPLGYPMRMGAVKHLNVADYRLLQDLLEQQQATEALKYLDAFHPQNIGMLTFAMEWSLQLAQTCLKLNNEKIERDCLKQALKNYLEDIKTLITEHGDLAECHLAIEDMTKLYSEQNLAPITVDDFRKYMSTGIQAPILKTYVSRIIKNYEFLKKAIESANFHQATELLQNYFKSSVMRHDGIVTFCSSYAGAVTSVCGEVMAERISNEALKSCPGWLGLWDLTKNMSQVELAAFLAEHFRFHFSGKGRQGATQIIEDDEKIQLVFEPCGGGGALRRRLGDKIPKLQKACDSSWGRSNEVPIYCSHCALNEQFSTDLYGYPRLVTQFNPDATKPCGWTFYKDPAKIPEEYFKRIGREKNS